MDTILQGILHVLYYIEDLLITDKTKDISSQPQEGAERIVDPWNCAQEVRMFLLTGVLWIIIDAEDLHICDRIWENRPYGDYC